MRYSAFSVDVSQELLKAQEKFGGTRWPQTSLQEWGLVLGEEVGELCQAIIEYLFGSAPTERIYEEAVQVSAMAYKVAEAAMKEGTAMAQGSEARPN